METNRINQKLFLPATVLLYLILILAAIKFQLLEGKKYYRLSETNRIKEVAITPPRGRVFDRKGRVVATVRPGYEVVALPAVINDSTILRLAQILKIPSSIIRARLRRTRNPYQMITIAHDIDFLTLSRLEENLATLNGVDVVTEPLRYYPYHQLLFHVLGFVGEIGGEVKRKSGYRLGDFIGKTGLEARLENRLRGEKGWRYVEINALGKEIGPVLEKRPIQPKPGEDLTITIDAELQESTASYLRDYPRAAVVGMELRSGEILILYSKPSIDPNLIVHGISRTTWDSIVNHPAAPLYNRATMSRYPPGSTFKVVTTIAALLAGWDTTRTIHCTGRFPFGDRVFHCWRRHGRIGFGQAIEKSCDCYFYTIGKEIGFDPILRVAQIFHLTSPTGIEIEEEGGFFPDSSYYERRYGSNWPRGLILNLAIGQGEILLTPLRLATMYAEIITGRRIRPHLLSEEVNFDPLPIDSSILDVVRQGLIRVVEEGTGRIVASYLRDAAGKTGTAQNPHGEDHSIFVGYTPTREPAFLVCVIVENAGHGASVAAPVAGKIMSLYRKRYAQEE
ncbi:penicillin-binding protein 2 [candidate division WOR-3 bacterium]|uniref:Beta-lactamase n=1 Tax=candidate division WOR-3 bacterium TaxID=2052148 RepID=A0A660SFF7_UNCW3|nr:MAG: penicillin-binding protein 2 [candidate division WOR-3 bacterium]